VLRMPVEADAPLMAAYRGDPDVARYQDWPLPYPPDDALAGIGRQAHLSGPTPGEAVNVAIEHDGSMVGDLYVEIAVRPHPIFEREGDDLTCEVPVSFATATLGGSVNVPTLQGEVSIKVPAGTQSGRMFRLRDQGVKPVRGGARGDLYCRVVVETPVDLTAEQRELLRKFDQSLRDDGRAHTPREEGFFEGVRRFFAGR